MRTAVLIALSYAILLHCGRCGGATQPEIEERNAIIASNHLGRTSLAYRATVSEKILAEANYFSRKLRLPIRYPIGLSAAEVHPASPLFSIEGGNMMALVDKSHPPKFFVRGTLETSNFFFSCIEGYLWSLGWKPGGGMGYDEGAPPVIDTNGAYRLATQWLAAVDVDVAALERKYRPKVEQEWYLSPSFSETGGDTNVLVATREPGQVDPKYRIMKPVFDVSWGGDAGAMVRVLGTRRELMELRLNDFSVSRRPQMVITNAIELNNMPDPPGGRGLQGRLPGGRANAPGGVEPEAPGPRR